jgi:hypothetical protein
MTKNDYKSFEKKHIQKLQQRIDELENKIKHLNNEIALCKETKDYPKELSKKAITATPLPRFEPPDVATILEGRIKAMKLYENKKR